MHRKIRMLFVACTLVSINGLVGTGSDPLEDLKREYTLKQVEWQGRAEQGRVDAEQSQVQIEADAARELAELQRQTKQG